MPLSFSSSPSPSVLIRFPTTFPSSLLFLFPHYLSLPSHLSGPLPFPSLLCPHPFPPYFTPPPSLPLWLAGLVTRLRRPPVQLVPNQPSLSSMFDDKWEIDKKNLQLGKELGSGQFGVCSILLSLTHTHGYHHCLFCDFYRYLSIPPFIPHTHNIRITHAPLTPYPHTHTTYLTTNPPHTNHTPITH